MHEEVNIFTEALENEIWNKVNTDNPSLDFSARERIVVKTVRDIAKTFVNDYFKRLYD